jgi:hypothetical protein
MALVSETTHPVCPDRDDGIPDEDFRTAMRFVLGRPGWRVEARATAEGAAYLRLATPCPGLRRQRLWRVARTHQGLLVCDEASGRRLRAVPTMREALVEIWEAVTAVASD